MRSGFARATVNHACGRQEGIGDHYGFGCVEVDINEPRGRFAEQETDVGVRGEVLGELLLR